MESLSTASARMVNGVRKLLFPPVCHFCKTPLTTESGCCSNCLGAISIWPHHHCARCGAEMAADLAPGPCGRCLNHPPLQTSTHSLYRYHGPVREAILDWKLQSRDSAIRWLLTQSLPHLREMVDQKSLLLPVPMPISRMRHSGQHHAANLCRWIADNTDAAWEWRLLRRIGEQPRQSSLSGVARRKNLCNAFSLDDDYLARWQDLADRVESVWIVDDIFTTGSTLHYSARACRKLNRPLHLLSLARTSQRG